MLKGLTGLEGRSGSFEFLLLLSVKLFLKSGVVYWFAESVYMHVIHRLLSLDALSRATLVKLLFARWFLILVESPSIHVFTLGHSMLLSALTTCNCTGMSFELTFVWNIYLTVQQLSPLAARSRTSA